MNIQSIHCYYFQQPLAHPFYVRAQQIKNREGLIVHVISDRGVMGFSEISPLPGISVEPFKKAAHQAATMVRGLKDPQAPSQPLLLLEWLSSRLPESSVCPSVRFGLESAVLSMAAATNQQSLHDFLRPGESARAVRSAGLLQGTSDEVVQQTNFLRSKGYTTFKLRVGSRNIPLDVQKVEEARRVMGSGSRLRLDANRGWRLDEALVFAQHVGKDRIEYIEEPVADPRQLEEFSRKTDMPLAVDETLQELGLDALAGRMGIGYIVARPMTMGITGFLRLLDAARPLGLQVIVTSAFESGVGMTVLANLAAMTPAIANLGTANWFDEDLLLRPVVVDAGRIPPDRLTLPTRFFHKALTRQLKAT